MAAIDGYLSKIKTAIYGEDVRDSIYQSISAINNECNTIMTSATDTINNYVDNIEIYAYVDELPAIGNEQKIYLVQEELEYINEWSDDYDISSYGGSAPTEFPAYLALEPQSEQDEHPSFYTVDTFLPSFTTASNFGHDFAVIVHISDYTEVSASVNNPEWAMLTVGIDVSTNDSSSNGNMLASIRSVLEVMDQKNNATDCPIQLMGPFGLYIPWGYYNGLFSNSVTMKKNTNISSTYNSRTMRYLHVNVKEYIYDSSTEKWIYNNSYSKKDISILSLSSTDTLQIASTSQGCELSSVILNQTNKTKYGWFAGIIRSATPLDSYILKVVNGSPSSVSYNLTNSIRYSSVYNEVNTRLTYFDPENYDIYNNYSMPSLKHPLQVINDVTYSGQMYVWNKQLQHYISMKSEPYYMPLDLEYKSVGGTYQWVLSKTYTEIDAYVKSSGSVDQSKRFEGNLIHPGPGKYGKLLNWRNVSGVYYFKYDMTTADSTSTTINYKVVSLDSTNTLTEVN